MDVDKEVGVVEAEAVVLYEAGEALRLELLSSAVGAEETAAKLLDE